MFIRMIGKAFLRQWKKMAMIAFTIALGASLATAMLSVMLDVGDKVNQELKAYGANINVVPKDASVISSLYDVGDENISGAYLREDELGKIKTIFWAFNIVDYAPFITAQASLDSGSKVNVKGTWFNHHMELPTGEQLDAGVASMRSWWGITEGDWLDEQKQEGTGYAMVGTDIAKKENINITDDALKIVVKRGGGSFRDSLSLLDQISTLSDEKIDADLITKALGLPQSEAITNILNGYAAGDANRIREQLQSLLDSGVKPDVIAENLISEILDNPQPIHLGLLDKLLDVSRSAYPHAKLLLAVIPQNIAMSAPAYVAAPAPAVQPKPAIAPKVTAKPAPVAQPKPVEKPAEKPAAPVEPAAPAPQEEPAPAPAVIAAEPSADDAEIWNNILNFAHDKIPAIARFLEKADYVFDGDTINIYTNVSKTHNNANKPSLNKSKIDAKAPMIAEFLGGKYTIEVSDQTLNKDPQMAEIAELMGGGEEVQLDAE